VLEVAKAQAGEPEFRCLAALTNHRGSTIRAWWRDVHSPTEELLRVLRFRCTFKDIGKDTAFHRE
jgi:hypothetical protein